MNSEMARSGDDGAIAGTDPCGVAVLGEGEERQDGGPSLRPVEQPTNLLG